MTTTTHYSITYIEAGQAGKYITCNEAFDTVDAALYALSSGSAVALAGDVTGMAGANTVTKIRGVAVSATAPTTNQYLQYNGTTWLPATLSVTLAGDVTGGYGANTVTKLRGVTVASTSPTNGYVLAYNSGTTQWEPTAPTVTSSVTMGGDISGSSASATVAKIQGRTVVSTAPSDLQYLGWNNGSTQWEPKTIALTLAGDVTGGYGANTVTKLQGSAVSATAPTTNYALVWSGSAWTPTVQPFDLSSYYPGVPAASAVLLRHIAVRAWSLPTNVAGSALSAGTAATASTVITLKKNGSSIGTATVAISGTTATFSVTATSFAAGDLFTVHAPSSADATLADVAVTFMGTR